MKQSQFLVDLFRKVVLKWGQDFAAIADGKIDRQLIIKLATAARINAIKFYFLI